MYLMHLPKVGVHISGPSFHQWNFPVRSAVQSPMDALRKRFLLAAALLAGTQLKAQTPADLTPRALIEKAATLRRDKSSPTRYTYFKLSHLKNSYKEHVVFGKRLFLDNTTLYEYTWIGDLPYGRVIELQGKPLTGDALAQEQARYDQAVADHSGLGSDARAKINHLTLIGDDFELKDLLTPAYAVTEIRQEQIAGNLTHVIDCVPTPSTDPRHPAATRHNQLWITNSGIILRESFDVLADEPQLFRGSHSQSDFQFIDGNTLPLHNIAHVYFFVPARKAVILVEAEDTFSRFRRFNVSTRILSPENSQ
jgi:hypothetical protein